MIKSTNDSNLRAAANRQGFQLQKGRINRCNRHWMRDGYRIVDMLYGSVVAGQNYDLTPEEVCNFLNEH